MESNCYNYFSTTKACLVSFTSGLTLVDNPCTFTSTRISVVP